MNRNYCRKAERDLGRTARYNLRRQRIELLRERRNEADPNQARDVVDNEHQQEGEENADFIQDVVDNEYQPEGEENIELNQDAPPAQQNIFEADEGNQPEIPEGNNMNDDPADDNHADHESDGEEDSETEDENEPVDLRRHRNLYDGAAITVGEIMTLMLCLMLRHNLTASCISDILAIFPLVCPRNGFQDISFYRFKKYFSLGRKASYKKHFYCTGCLSGLPTENADCQLCRRVVKKAYFLEMSFITQLQQMLKRNNFHEMLQHRFQRELPRPDTLVDIYDGEIYQSQVEHDGILSDPNNISFMWYTDGVPVFKSSKTSMWPIYLIINELPYRQRIQHENMLLAGLWFGKKKAAPNLFFGSLERQLRILYNGRNFTLPNGREIRMRGVLLAGTCDVPAKTSFLYLTLYNGAFGCCNCKLEGHTLNHQNGGHSHVYPYVRNIQERTSEETKAFGRQVVEEELVGGVMGVKGLSVLSNFMPDYIGGTGIDVMHKVYGGTVKKLLFLWFDSSYSGQPFSLRLIIPNIDRRFTSIKPPKFIHRMPRTVLELCHWKCSELQMWFHYFSLPVLSGLMMPLYLNHFALLIYAIGVLNTESVTLTDIERSRKLLHKFVRLFSDLYGERQMTINVHGLLHLPDCVKRLGPVWVYNCFPFEDINGRLLKLVHGTSNLDSQIADRHNNVIKLHANFQNLDEGNLRDFILHLKKRQVKINERVFQCCYSVGEMQILQEVPQQLRASLAAANVRLGKIYVYLRLLKDSKLFISENYPKPMKTVSSFVLFIRNGIRQVGSIIKFLKVTYCNCANRCICNGEHYALINEFYTNTCFDVVDDDNHHYPVSYLKKCRRSNVVSAIPVKDLLSICVYISINDEHNYVGLPLNSQEAE